MNSKKHLTPEFVEFIPEKIQDGRLYISMKYATAVHKCCCGCGNEVVTPFSPSDWHLLFDGEKVSLHPSIGNWNFKCRSHYFIRNNNIIWDCLKAHSKWNEFDLPNSDISIKKKSLWQKLKKWLRHFFA